MTITSTSSKCSRLVSSAASVNATIAFDGPTRLDGIEGYNTKASTIFIKLYQLTAAQIAGPTLPAQTDTPFLTLAIPASAAFAFDWIKGIRFNVGMGYRITTGSADNDTGALLAGDVLGLNFLAG